MAEGVDIGSLKLQIEDNAQQSVVGIDALAKSLSTLKSAVKGGLGLGTVANNLTKIKDAVSNLSGIDFSAITSLSNALSSLKMKNTGFTATVNGLKKIPEVFAQLNKVDMVAFGAKINEIAKAMEPLAKEMDAVARGFSAFPAKIQKFLNSTAKVPTHNKAVGKSFSMMASRIMISVFALRRVARIFASWITESNKYIENLNLFNASMGEYAKQSKDYAERVGETLGIDPGEWMRNQGVFQTLATGFGVVESRATTMSKNLTQLGYDLSSFFNISIASAMQKLQSGLAGELEPLNLAA